MEHHNPLIAGIVQVQNRVTDFKAAAKEFYFQVILSKYSCPTCGQKLVMIGTSLCSCPAGHRFDPTLAFQSSHCCQSRLIRQVKHYACATCKQKVPSRFLFDEQLFDADYFRAKMQEHRTRIQNKKEAMRRLLAESRSAEWLLDEAPNLEEIPGLLEALQGFVRPASEASGHLFLEGEDAYDYSVYRRHLLSGLGWSPALFSEMHPYAADARRDRIWRFMTLLFMDQAREVDLSQHGSDLMIRRLHHEAD